MADQDSLEYVHRNWHVPREVDGSSQDEAWEKVVQGLAELGVAIDSSSRLHLSGQNRFRHLNSCASVTPDADQDGITTGTWTTRNFATEEFDTDTLHDTVSDNSRLTAKFAGKYWVGGTLHIDGASVTTPSNAGARILVNGGTTTVYGQYTPYVGAAVEIVVTTSVLLNLSANDYVEIQGVFFGGGGTFDLTNADGVTRFQMIYLGE